MEPTLNLERRDGVGKGAARKMRRAGRIPGVVYGGGREVVKVSMEAQEPLHLFQSVSVENTIIDLRMEGESQQALVREIQAHPHRTELVHVDFIRILRGVAMEVQIPLQLVGTPEGVRSEGGNLDHIVHEVPVRCIPSKIPEAIELDVTDLMIGDSLRGKDIVMPADVENLLDPEQTVCQVSAPRVEEEAAEPGDLEGLEGEEGAMAAEGEDGPAAEDASSEESAG
ncbi:MAG: 50S ribosomal protein L25 [Longimicrobiales bacterium]